MLNFFSFFFKSKRKRFSVEFKYVLDSARSEALRLGHDYVGSEHFLLGILEHKDSLPNQVLGSINISIDNLKQKLENSIPKTNSHLSNLNIGNVSLNAQAEKVLQYAVLEAYEMGSVGDEAHPEHLMLSILKLKEMAITQLLNDSSLDYEKFKLKMEEILVKLDYKSSKTIDALL